LIPEGPLVSRPYLEMTLKMMRYFGADVTWEGDSIQVQPGEYKPRPLAVEADWSGASYWYAMAVFADDLELRLEGFHTESWQGDAALVQMMQNFGIQSDFEENTLVLTKSGTAPKAVFEQDFLECPDIAQTLAIVCGGLGTMGIFSGLETLSIKETDRIAALKTELGKVGVSFAKLPAYMNKRSPEKTFYQVQGKAAWTESPRFATYGDHRMAMAFAALAMLGVVEIENPKVVVKSYPEFWEHLEKLGFLAEEVA
jgi:3-phosphoshikimate 1-carboxyvinyltransferase